MVWFAGLTAPKVADNVPHRVEFVAPLAFGGPAIVAKERGDAAGTSSMFDDNFLAPSRFQRVRAEKYKVPTLCQKAAENRTAPSFWQKTIYKIYGLLWWLRRLGGERSRIADKVAVEAFLVKHGLYDGKNKRFLCVIERDSLIAIGMPSQFWWLSTAQMQSIADASRCMLTRAEKIRKSDQDACIEEALFSRRLRSVAKYTQKI